MKTSSNNKALVALIFGIIAIHMFLIGMFTGLHSGIIIFLSMIDALFAFSSE